MSDPETECWHPGSGQLMWKALRLARASLGDTQQRLRLELARKDRAVASLHDHEAELAAQADEIDQLQSAIEDMELKTEAAAIALAAQEREFGEAQERLSGTKSHVFSEMDKCCAVIYGDADIAEATSRVTFQGDAEATPRSHPGAQLRAQIASSRRTANVLRTEIRDEQSETQALQLHHETHLMQQRDAARDLCSRREHIQLRAATEAQEAATLRKELAAATRRQQQSSKESTEAESALRRMVLQRFLMVERLRTEAQQVSQELQRAESSASRPRPTRFLRQVAQREVRNQQLEARLVEATTALRWSQEELQHRSDRAAQLRGELTEEREAAEMASARCEETYLLAESAREVEAARAEQAVTVSELRAEIRARQLLAREQSERLVQEEIQQVRNDIAREEMSLDPVRRQQLLFGSPAQIRSSTAW